MSRKELLWSLGRKIQAVDWDSSRWHAGQSQHQARHDHTEQQYGDKFCAFTQRRIPTNWDCSVMRSLVSLHPYRRTIQSDPGEDDAGRMPPLQGP